MFWFLSMFGYAIEKWAVMTCVGDGFGVGFGMWTGIRVGVRVGLGWGSG